jgi:hypothetical protein
MAVSMYRIARAGTAPLRVPRVMLLNAKHRPIGQKDKDEQ